AKAIDTLTGVLAVEPNQADPRLALYDAHLGRAGALQKLDRPEDAKKDYRRMLELSEGGRHENYVHYRPRALGYLSEHARAAAEMGARLAQGPLPESLWKEFAGVYAICSVAARQDETLPPTEREALAERYATRALALLRKAAELGVFRSAK